MTQTLISIRDVASDRDVRERVFLSAYHARRDGHLHTAEALEDLYIQLCVDEGSPCSYGRDACHAICARCPMTQLL